MNLIRLRLRGSNHHFFQTLLAKQVRGQDMYRGGERDLISLLEKFPKAWTSHKRSGHVQRWRKGPYLFIRGVTKGIDTAKKTDKEKFRIGRKCQGPHPRQHLIATWPSLGSPKQSLNGVIILLSRAVNMFVEDCLSGSLHKRVQPIVSSTIPWADGPGMSKEVS